MIARYTAKFKNTKDIEVEGTYTLKANSRLFYTEYLAISLIIWSRLSEIQTSG